MSQSITSTRPTITLCIVNYNGSRHLRSSLPAAASLADTFEEIILLDNASTDESIVFVEANFPSIRIVRLAENRGPGAARNAGLREARTRRVLLIDNDVALAPECPALLAAALDADPAAAVAAPRVIYAHDRTLIQYDGGAHNHFLGLMIFSSQDRKLPAEAEPVQSVDGVVSACFLIDRDRLAGEEFDESFFIYYEDHDFGLRLRLMGRAILAVPQAHCYHGSGTEGLSLRGTGTFTSRRVMLTIRNRWILLMKNYSLRSLIVLAPILIAFEAAQFVVVLRKGWFGEWRQAAAWILRHRADILEKRVHVQRSRAINDGRLLRGGPVPFRNELTASRLEQRLRGAFDALAIGYWRVVGGHL